MQDTISTCSIKTGGKWKAHPAQEIGLLEALADPTVADLYWCGFLKFQRDLRLTTPSDAAMIAMFGILEPMCQPEEVLEIGAMEEVDERQEISPPCGADSPSGCRCRCCCCCCSCCCCAVATAVVAVARNGPLLVDDAEPFDLVAHFLTNYSVL